MKRAIYIGKPWLGMDYGSTGAIKNLEWSEAPLKTCFRPDGSNDEYWADRCDLYIPSEDQTRHCPKPS